jgi:predicted RNase H-like HicB family nuclease
MIEDDGWRFISKKGVTGSSSTPPGTDASRLPDTRITTFIRGRSPRSSDRRVLWKNRALMKYAIVIEKAEGSNYSAYAPDLPGCAATADTLDDVKRLMREGIEFHLEGLREDGLPLPAPTTQVDYAEVAA